MLEVDAELFEDAIRVVEDIHQVRDGRALITGNVGNSGLQQGLRDREDSLTMEYFTFTEIKFLNFFLEGAFRDGRLTGPLAPIEGRAG